MSKSKTTKPGGTKWTVQERELAVSMRAEHQVKEIADTLGKSTKAVERFFERISLTKDMAIEQKLNKTTKFSGKNRMVGAQTGLTTTWGDPLLVRKLEIEFGHCTPIAPVVILPDIHAGAEDQKAIDLACKIIDVINPVAVVYLGDNIDFEMLSTFAVGPTRITKAQEEIDTFHKIDKQIAAAAGSNTKRYWLIGNHEDRVWRMMQASPNISSFRGLQMDALFGLDKDWSVIKNLQIVEDEINWREKFIMKHGKRVSSFSAYSARKELADEGISGISGHVHRAGAYYESKRGHDKVWFEGGCLCDLNPGYIKNKPNWQHAVNIGYFNADKANDFFHIDQVVFSGYKAVVNGELLSV